MGLYLTENGEKTDRKNSRNEGLATRKHHSLQEWPLAWYRGRDGLGKAGEEGCRQVAKGLACPQRSGACPGGKE